MVLLPNGRGREGVLDTRTKGWEEAGRNRDGTSISLLNIEIYRRRSHDAFRPGIHHQLATNTPICSNSIFVPISRSIIPPASSAFD